MRKRPLIIGLVFVAFIAIAVVAAITGLNNTPQTTTNGTLTEIPLLNDQFFADTSIVDNLPCEAPCWRSIVPGITLWGELPVILEHDPSIIDVETGRDSNGLGVTFRGDNGVPCCLIYSRDSERVDQILIQLAPINRLGAVIGNLGEPTYVGTANISSTQAAMELYYPARQIVVYVFIPGQSGRVNADSRVFAVLYLSETSMRTNIGDSALYDWHGYDTYVSYDTGAYIVTPVPANSGD